MARAVLDMEKKKLIILLIIFLFIVFGYFTFYLKFSEVSGIVLDGDNNPVINQKIKITYACNPNLCLSPAGCDPSDLGYKETYTDNKGKFYFNNLNYGIYPAYNCWKSVSGDCTSAEEYCLESTRSFKGLLEKNQKEINLISYKNKIYSPGYQCKIMHYLTDSLCDEEGFLDAIRNRNVSACKSDDFFPGNECYTEMALALKNISICEEITLENANYYSSTSIEEDRQGCYEKYGNEYGNVALCGDRIGTECFRTMAIKMKDISMCDKSGGFKANCQYRVAILMGYIESCSYIEEPKERKMCKIYYT